MQQLVVTNHKRPSSSQAPTLGPNLMTLHPLCPTPILSEIETSLFHISKQSPVIQFHIVELCSAFRVLKKDLAIQCFQFPQQASRFSCRTSVVFWPPNRSLYGMEWNPCAISNGLRTRTQPSYLIVSISKCPKSSQRS